MRGSADVTTSVAPNATTSRRHRIRLPNGAEVDIDFTTHIFPAGAWSSWCRARAAAQLSPAPRAPLQHISTAHRLVWPDKPRSACLIIYSNIRIM